MGAASLIRAARPPVGRRPRARVRGHGGQEGRGSAGRAAPVAKQFANDRTDAQVVQGMASGRASPR